MKIPALLFMTLWVAFPCLGQVPDPGTESENTAGDRAPVALPVNPGAAQDAEAAREKLLKASDELDMIQSNSEATKSAVDDMKADIAKLQAENDTLKQQMADLQAALNKAQSEHEQDEAARAKEKQVILDEVASLIEAGKGSGHTSPKKHPVAETSSDSSTEVHTRHDDSAEAETSSPAPESPPDKTSATDDSGNLAPPPDASPPKPQKGYYHIVESGETLSMICAAYRDQGVKVSLAQVKKANGLTSKSVLKVGQKLFIPKPEP